MLSARKLHLAAGLKVAGVDLRKAELDFHMSRYTAVSGISTIITGLGYVGMIKIKIPENYAVSWGKTNWTVFGFYTCDAIALAAALLNLFISGFLVVGAQGLTLRGPPNSVARCVDILGRFWLLTKCMLALSLTGLLGAGGFICWMKLEAVDEELLHGAHVSAIGCTVVFAIAIGAAYTRIARLSRELAIDNQSMVRGDLTVTTPLQAPGAPGGAQNGGAGPSSSHGAGATTQAVDLVVQEQPFIPVASS